MGEWAGDRPDLSNSLDALALNHLQTLAPISSGTDNASVIQFQVLDRVQRLRPDACAAQHAPQRQHCPRFRRASWSAKHRVEHAPKPHPLLNHLKRPMMQAFWYKNVIFYSLDVETFFDANGDGIGDFCGLTTKLDYLTSLGVTCLWLLPFYPSPNRDNGYDIIDYYNVDARLGTLGNFAEFMHQAKARGIRVLLDLVVNHTSIEHPWFQASRSDPSSSFRNRYVWRENPPPQDSAEVAFPGIQESLWPYDEQAGAYYLHRFYREQPDLNIANPAVREEICRIMGFWLELGALMMPRLMLAVFPSCLTATAGLKSSGKFLLQHNQNLLTPD